MVENRDKQPTNVETSRETEIERGPLYLVTLAVAEVVPEWVTDRMIIATDRPNTVFLGLAVEDFRISRHLRVDGLNIVSGLLKLKVEDAVRRLGETVNEWRQAVDDAVEGDDER